MQKFSKGIENIPTGIFVLLVTAGLIAFVYILGIENFFDIKVIVKEFQIERQTIDLAQALLTSEQLAYNDGNRFYRAIYDKGKLDSMLKKGETGFDFLSPNDKITVMYPNSVAIFQVKDLKTGETWSSVIKGPYVFKISEGQQLTCLGNSAKIDLGSFFRLIAWDLEDIKKCLIDKGISSGDLPSYSFSNSDISKRGFPVAIKSGDEIHVGRMSVELVQWL